MLECRRCKLAIAPEDPIITIACGSPSKMEKEITWHVQCAPMIVRQHIPPAKGGITVVEKQQRQD